MCSSSLAERSWRQAAVDRSRCSRLISSGSQVRVLPGAASRGRFESGMSAIALADRHVRKDAVEAWRVTTASRRALPTPRRPFASASPNPNRRERRRLLGSKGGDLSNAPAGDGEVRGWSRASPAGSRRALTRGSVCNPISPIVIFSALLVAGVGSAALVAHAASRSSGSTFPFAAYNAARRALPRGADQTLRLQRALIDPPVRPAPRGASRQPRETR
jgi:hypothetical protein